MIASAYTCVLSMVSPRQALTSTCTTSPACLTHAMQALQCSTHASRAVSRARCVTRSQQVTDTVYPMYKAYIEPDLRSAQLQIYNAFNPFSGFMHPVSGMRGWGST